MGSFAVAAFAGDNKFIDIRVISVMRVMRVIRLLG